MTNRTQFNARLPGITHDQIDLIAETYGLTKTQVLIMAVDRLASDLNPDPDLGDGDARHAAYQLANGNQ